jgi:uncharacterized protein YfdQ (DUF2303 family)
MTADEQVIAERNTEAAVVADIAVRAVSPTAPDPAKAHVVVVPVGGKVETIDLERFLPAPRRATGVYHPATLASFVEYVKTHAHDNATTIWVDQASASVTAILNDNGREGSAWRDHQAILKLTPTAEWLHWMRSDGKLLAQETFAEHIQDGTLEIVEPDGATMLEIAQTMEGKTGVQWKSGTRLDNGEVSLMYVEQVEATAGRKGDTAIPQSMELAIAPYLGGEKVHVGARVRFRIREGNLTIGYQLERPQDVLLGVLQGIADDLGEKFARVYLGTPAR